MSTITKNTSVAEIVKRCPTARKIFDKHGLKGCGGEQGPAESLAFFASVHQVDVEKLLDDLKAEMKKPSAEKYASYGGSVNNARRRGFTPPGINRQAGKMPALPRSRADKKRLGVTAAMLRRASLEARLERSRTETPQSLRRQERRPPPPQTSAQVHGRPLR